ncbi:MAG: 2OG-Fe(II) oxygenase [Deltaproteobacteria bacterium]|nr:2OG-Fe(II) oxygenase [Deltaproteobacteria bacterium]
MDLALSSSSRAASLGLPFPAIAIDGFFSPAECAAMIAAAERKGFGKTGHLYPAEYRNNDRLMLDDAALAASLFKRVRGDLPIATDERGHVLTPIGLNARFRFCRYSAGQRFSVHRDGAYCRPNGDASRMTVQIYLNDGSEFSGGSTRFFADHDAREVLLAVRPALGRAIVFDHRLWHDGDAVPRGTKYVMRTDVMFANAAPETNAHTGYIWRIAQGNEGAIYTSSRDGTIRRWNHALESTARLAGPGGSIGALALTPDGLVAATREGHVFTTGRDLAARTTLAEVDTAVIDLCAAANGAVILSCADGSLQRVDGASVRAHTGWASALASMPRRDLVASVGHDGVLSVRRASDLGEVARYVHGAPLYAVAANDWQIWIGDAHGRLVTLRFGCDNFRVESIAQAHASTITSIVPHGLNVATCGEDNRARIAAISRPQTPLAITEHTDFARGAVWLDDRTIVSAGYDALLRKSEIS